MGEDTVEQQVEQLSKLAETATEFVVAYGFQILGAVVVLIIGLWVANMAAKRVARFCARRDFDPTLSKFAANVVRVLLIAIVVIITLSNFGITISPFIALAGAATLGITLAVQGPLSNYGAGLAIILTRPFVIGNTIKVKGQYGVVDDIQLAATVLLGEDKERITIPNKEIMGEVVVNSNAHRVVETKVVIRYDAEVDKAIGAVRQAIGALAPGDDAPPAQVGVHDLFYGGIILGARYWVPSLSYFQQRYAVNRAILMALHGAGVELITIQDPEVLSSTLAPEGGFGGEQ